MNVLSFFNVVVNNSIPDNKIFASNGAVVNFDINHNLDGNIFYMSTHTFTKLIFIIYKDDFDTAIKVLCGKTLDMLNRKIEYAFNIKYMNYIKEL